jgi:hypothetical protein
MTDTFDAAWLADVREQFGKLKTLAERALEQVPDESLNITIDDESNSLAVIVKHMAGNQRSRFTDFLTTDGEKPDRTRDGEFEVNGQPDRAAVMADWNRGWGILFDTLASLGPADLRRDVYIRGERHSVMQAIHRQMTHHAYHVGQIVFLAKHLQSSDWKTLSMPRRRPPSP